MKTNKILYQWDAGQKLTDCRGVFVDFVISGEVYRCDVVNGECIVPDELLQHPGKQTAYECMADNTLQEFVFSVVPRPLPPDYVYTPTEKLTFEGLVQKVDDTVADIIRRADTGEFDGYTPVKGKDYFTESEKNEMMQRVSDGAIGEFREVVDSATADFNKNSSVKTNDYNTNAETKTAEFDANADALQTEVDRLRGECDNLAAENRKQENRISALMKLNKGQTYDILPEQGESASRTAPSGVKYVSVDKVGGKSVVWNQQVDDSNAELGTVAGVTLSRNENGRLFASGTVQTGRTRWLVVGEASLIVGHKYLSRRIGQGVPLRVEKLNGNINMVFNNDFEVKILTEISKNKVFAPIGEGVTVNLEIVPVLIDLTQMFGAGKEPTAEQFEQMFPAESYPYNPGEIISSRTATITAGAETITTGFPELHSAGTAHDEIDMDGGAIRRNVGTVDLGSLTWDNNGTLEDGNVQFIAKIPGRAYTGNGLCDRFEKSEDNALGTYTLRTNGDQITFTAPEGTEINAFIESVSGATLYYELATPTTEQVAIPEPLQEWLPVEPGGTVTFRNADESKQLAVPNAVSWVRKLNEVE